jgi:hypothetical protein
MQTGGRKRVVSSCMPCYKKKQKVRMSLSNQTLSVRLTWLLLTQCNRHYPCNQCTRRRKPEDCIYHLLQASQAPQTENRPLENTPADHDAQSQDASGHEGNEEPAGLSSECSTRRNSTVVQGSERDSLAELFGYVEHSESNTLALVRRVSACSSSTLCRSSSLMGVHAVGCKRGRPRKCKLRNPARNFQGD